MAIVNTKYYVFRGKKTSNSKIVSFNKYFIGIEHFIIVFISAASGAINGVF